MVPEFNEKFLSYLKGCQEVHDDYIGRHGFTESQRDELTFKVGRRYVKVIMGSSVHSFVDMKNGNVLKPAGWSAPAKHPRGNIYDENNGLAGMTFCGPYYLK
jgi:hypothetical protein